MASTAMKNVPNSADAQESKIDSRFTTHPLMLICLRKIESDRAFAIDLRSTEPAYIVENSILVWALTALPEQFTKAEAVAVWSREARAAKIVEDIWNFATSEGLVLSLSKAAPLAARLALWDDTGWSEAGVYHEGTRDYPFVDMSRKDAFLADNKRMKDYEDGWAAPSVYQSFPAIAQVQLEKVTDDFAEYLKTRKLPDPQKDLSLIFDFCFGERIRLEHAFDEQNFLQLESLRKTIPSGGGRHPTEVFFAIFDTRFGLWPGLYHYNVKANSLDLIRRGDLYDEIQDLLPVSMSQGNRPSALLFFTSLSERAMWRYRDPRSWRAFVIDIGHAEYMCAQVCDALGLSLKSCHGVNSTGIARYLGIDPYRQPVMSVATLSANL